MLISSLEEIAYNKGYLLLKELKNIRDSILCYNLIEIY